MKYGKHSWQYTSTDGTSMECTECGLAINYSDSSFFQLLDSDCPEIVIDNLCGTHGGGVGRNPNHAYCGECARDTCLECPSKDKTAKI